MCGLLLANFLVPLPGWPVTEACKKMSTQVHFMSMYNASSNNLLDGLLQVANVYYNYTGQVPCTNLTQPDSPYLGDLGWSYQACTEMIMPVGSNGVTDMFPFMPFDMKSYLLQCEKQWGVIPKPRWVETHYGGRGRGLDLKYASNIVFSNGDLDPWSSGGVTTSVSDSVVAVMIENGAHHLDLRFSNPADPQSVKDARRIEVEHIAKWVKQAQERNK